MTDRLLIRVIQSVAVVGCLALIAAPIWDHWAHRNQTVSAGASIGDEIVTPAHAAPRPAFGRPAGAALIASGPMAVIGGTPAIASINGSRPDPRPVSIPEVPVFAASNAGVRPAAATTRSGASPAGPSQPLPGAAGGFPRPPAGGAGSQDPPRKDRSTSGGAAPMLLAAGAAIAPDPPGAGPGQNPPPTTGSPARTPDPGTPSGGQQPDTDPPDTPASPMRLALVSARATAAPGEVVVVKVRLRDAVEVSSVPFHLKFDPDRFEYLSARAGSAFNGTSLQPVLMVAENPDRRGDVAFGLVLAGAPTTFSGTGDLAILEFRALQAGAAHLLIEDVSIRGPISEPLAAEIENLSLQVN